MAYRDRQLLIDSLGHIWSDTTAAAGTTCAVSVSASSSHERYHLTSLGWSVKNTQAAATTVSVNVAHASGTTAPTVLGSWDIVVAAGATAQDTWRVHFSGKKGQGIQAYFAPVSATSVVEKVTACGYVEKGSD